MMEIKAGVRRQGAAICVAAAMAVLALIAAAGDCRAQAAKNVTAERCGVDFKKPTQRVFADAEGKGHWTEYRSVADAPDVNLNDGELARIWPGTDGNTLVRIEEPGEDFAIYTDYCFDKDGGLSQAGLEVRTAWGWGFREQGPVKDGAIAAETKEFFDIVKDTIVAKPDAANDIPEALKPKLYAKIADLPFAKLLAPPKTQ